MSGSTRPLRVREVMDLAPLTVGEDDSLGHAARALSERRTDELAVCSGDGRLVAVVGHADVTAAIAAGRGADTPVTVVARVPTACAGVDDPAEEALLTMLHSGVRRLPVLERERLVGSVTQTALLLALSEETVDGILAVVSGRAQDPRTGLPSP